MLYSFKSVSNLRHFMCHLHRSTPTWHILLQKYKNKLVKHEKKCVKIVMYFKIMCLF